MATAVIKQKNPSMMESVARNSLAVGSTKTVLVLAKTALGSLGQVMQKAGASTAAQLGGRLQNLGGLFGSMAGGYALNDFGESLTGAVGSALKLRREVSSDTVLDFVGSSALAASEAMGAVGFIASRGALALGGAAAAIELISMATLALGAAIMAVRAFLELRSEQVKLNGAPPTPEQEAKLSRLKWTIAKMAMLVGVGLLGVASATALPAFGLGMASTCLVTAFFASELFTKIQGRTAPKGEETVSENLLSPAKPDAELNPGEAVKIFRDRLSAEDAQCKGEELSKRERWAAQERVVDAAQELFSIIPGQKAIQGFTRGIADVASLAVGALGREELAQTISSKSDQVAGGLMPQSEAVANAAGLVKALQTKEKGLSAAAEIGKAGGKVVADAAKITSVLAKFKVFEISKTLLKPIDVIGKSGDFLQALLTVCRGKPVRTAPATHPGKVEIDATARRVAAWNQVREWAKLTLTVLALLPPVLAAFSRSAPALALRVLSAGAGLTMGTAATIAHFVGRTSRYQPDYEMVDLVRSDQH